ncbi:carbohydrate sulfotransferase 13-like [Lampetra fluviatilis]
MRLRLFRMALFSCGCSILLALAYLHGSLAPGVAPFRTRSLGDVDGILSWEQRVAIVSADPVQRARRERLSRGCNAIQEGGPGGGPGGGPKRRVLSPADLKHLLVDDEHRLIYCYVPKVACTNWKRVMLVLSGRARGRQAQAIPAHEAHVPGALRSLAHFNASEINRRLHSYLSFLFVRHPFERLVSAYTNKFTKRYNTAFHSRYGTRIIQRHRHAPGAEAARRGSDVRFEEFAWYLADPRTRAEEPFNEHWETAAALCHPCHVRYDVVGKYETLQRDAGLVLRLAGAGADVQFPPAPARARRGGGDGGGGRGGKVSEARREALKHFRTLGAHYRRRLYALYRHDFLLFNYSAAAFMDAR